MTSSNHSVSTAAFVVALLVSTLAPVVGGELAVEQVAVIGAEGSGEGQFKYVEDFAFSRDGHLLVTDASHAWVQVFDKRTGRFITRFGGKGDSDGQLDKPEGIAVAPDGTVFVADYNTGFVHRFDPSFRWLSSFSEYGSERGQNIKSEFMDIAGGKLFMPEAGNHRISVFDLAGVFLYSFGAKGSAAGQFNNPEAAKVGPNARLYVSDLANDRIQVFSLEGDFLWGFGASGTGPGQLRSPAGIAFDKDGNVYVAEIGNSRIQVFDPSGKPLGTWGRKGSGVGEFENIHGIAIEPGGLIYVADTGNNRIQVFRVTPAAAAAISPRQAVQ